MSHEPGPQDDLVARMIAAAPAARSCCDPTEELHPAALNVTGDHAGVGILRIVPGQRVGDPS